MSEELTKLQPILPLRSTLEGLRIGGSVNAPRYQRNSIKQAIFNIKDQCQKRYSIKTINDYVITVKRIR